MLRTLLRLALLPALLLASNVAPADTLPPKSKMVGVTSEEIRIGNTNRYSGPPHATVYATVGRVVAAYFQKVNDEGGVNGRKLTFITYDDGYKPDEALKMARRLVEQDRVALLFQTVGTRANFAMRSYLNAQRVPHLFLTSGSSKWNDPQGFPWTMSWQPSYQTEGRIYAAYIREKLPNAKIGILYQDDDYGRDYRKGLLEGLGEAAKRLVVLEQPYKVDDARIDSKIVNLKRSGANVLYSATTPTFALQAIRKAHEIGWKPTHLLNSVSRHVIDGADHTGWHPRALLAAALRALMRPFRGDPADGLITALYQKEVADPQWREDKGYLDWVRFMRDYYPQGALDAQANVYGYLLAQTLVHVLRQCGDDLSRENIIKQAADIRDLELPLLLPGVKINTSPSDFAPIEQAQLARFDGKRWVLFSRVYDASMR